MKPTLKAPESKRLKLEHEKTLPNFGFKFNLRRYNVVADEKPGVSKPMQSMMESMSDGISGVLKMPTKCSFNTWQGGH